MNIDIFIRTYKKDFPILKYSIISILKFVKSYNNIIITVRDKEFSELISYFEKETFFIENKNKIKIYSVPNFQDNIDYLGQQITKLHADIYSSADYIFYIDSDCIFYDFFDIKTMFTNNKINLIVENWEKLPEIVLIWKYFLNKINLKTPYEYMRRLPLIYPSIILKNVREFISNKYKTNFVNSCLYIYNQIKNELPDKYPLYFSEFNLLGAYSFLYNPEYYNFVKSNDVEEIPSKQLQHCNYNNDTNKQIIEMKRLLKL